MMRYLTIICMTLALFSARIAVSAEEQAAQSTGTWLTKSLRVLLFGGLQDPPDSSLNPDNAFLQVPRYEATLALRPDFLAETSWVNGTFKPRVLATETWRRDGAPAGMRDREARFFVNEWLVQPKLHDKLVLSFGKEKLLWGPSFLVSPSNILFRDTEKANPKAEVEGKYLARLVWMPNTVLTITAGSETQKQEGLVQEQEKPFRIVKLDVMGGSSLVSVIGYHRQDDRFRMGSFGQWTVSDAVLIYYDGMVTKGTDALYPIVDPAQPLGGDFQKIYADSGRYFITITAGGSYTFLSGETVSMEFLYNGAGYGDAAAADYYRLRRSAADHFFDSGALAGLSRKTLAESLAAESPFLRRYYLMAQVNSGEIGNSLTILLRYVRGLEERTGQASSVLEWTLSDRIQLFNITTIALGDGEFSAVLDKSSLLGVEAHW